MRSFPRALTPERAGVGDRRALRGRRHELSEDRYIRDLWSRVQDGSLDLDALHDLPDEAVVEALTQVKGIGRWTAEMFLMFRLHRPDVLPVGDLGIVRAVQRAYRLRNAADSGTAAAAGRAMATLPLSCVLVSLGESR